MEDAFNIMTAESSSALAFHKCFMKGKKKPKLDKANLQKTKTIFFCSLRFDLFPSHRNQFRLLTATLSSTHKKRVQSKKNSEKKKKKGKKKQEIKINRNKPLSPNFENCLNFCGMLFLSFMSSPLLHTHNTSTSSATSTVLLAHCTQQPTQHRSYAF